MVGAKGCFAIGGDTGSEALLGWWVAKCSPGVARARQRWYTGIAMFRVACVFTWAALCLRLFFDRRLR